jgi:hypothetical protein
MKQIKYEKFLKQWNKYAVKWRQHKVDSSYLYAVLGKIFSKLADR